MGKCLLVNAATVKTGGGLTVLAAIAKELEGADCVFVVSPEGANCLRHIAAKVIIVPPFYRIGLLYPVLQLFWLPMIGLRKRATTILNLCNVPIPTRKRQVMYFHWPYALYTDDEVWSGLFFRGWVVRQLKVKLIKILAPFASEFIVQTESVRRRLAALFPNKPVFVVAPGVESDFGNYGSSVKCINEQRYIYPAYPYPHKNHQVVLRIARLLKKRGIKNVRLVLTLGNDAASRTILHNIKKERLEDIIDNVGILSQKEIVLEYDRSVALLMPTLLETFGLPYIEAMSRGLPVVTSDRDFARDVCGAGALYCDPHDESDILEKMLLLQGEARVYLVNAAKSRAMEFGSWKESAQRVKAILAEDLKGSFTCH